MFEYKNIYMIYVRKFRSAIYLLVLLFVFNLYACRQVNTEVIPSSKYSSYVTAYTGGVVSKRSAIRVELAQDLPVVELNTEIKGQPFSFSPSLKGKAYWVSNNTIEFVPEDGALKSGEVYKATFKLGNYLEVDKGLRNFDFTFHVVESSFSIDASAINIQTSDPEVVSIEGKLHFSDVVDKKVVEKMIVVKSSSKQSLSVSIVQTNDPLTYNFIIDNIKKGREDGKVDIEVSGKPLGISSTAMHSVTIPAKDTFVFLEAKRISEPENGIQVVFSEPLDLTQNLKGLIELKGAHTTFQVQDNIINVFFESGQCNKLTLNVHTGIKSASGKKLMSDATVSINTVTAKPQVELISKGTILPDSKNLIIPFRAVGLHAVDLSVIRVFENNVLPFLQTNSLSSSGELRRSGRLVCKKMLRLDSEPSNDITQWADYSIDLTGLIKQEPGAIYHIMLSFTQEYSAYPCGGDVGVKRLSDNSQLVKIVSDGLSEEDIEPWDVPQSYYNLEYEGYDWRKYDWTERDNPCHPSYYMNPERKVFCNVLATNLGVIIKRNAMNKLWLAVNNILDTTPVEGAELTVYNYQLQPIGVAKTDQDGFAVIAPDGVPFVVVATDGNQKTYLKVMDGAENSTSRFDVNGKEVKKGLKGFIYGERGVWRPGDTLHISFILEDQEKRIPSTHPVSIELFNPSGQFYTKQISTNGMDGFYTFHIPIGADDQTGVWNAYVKVGGTSFHKSLRIETVKPNRLKINLKLPSEVIKAGEGDVPVKLSSSWLTGAVAADLKVKVEMKLSKTNTQFAQYPNYIFNNPATEYASSNTQVFDGVLNRNGDAEFSMKVPTSANAPGLLQADIVTRVFEPGGDASINILSAPFSPFESYVGINLNQPKGRYFETDKKHQFDVVTVDAEGKPIDRSALEYKIYSIGWSWWWEKRNESFESYINNTSIVPVSEGTLSTVNGKAQFSFRVDYPEWGRYLVYVKDKESGHATGATIYVDWPESVGRSNRTNPSNVKMLVFSMDKESYEIGETVTVTIPPSSSGRALIGIENGASVLQRKWVEVSEKEETKFQFKVTSEMAPNVYVHISLLQPHAQTVNDLPIRMYGVMPVFVTNKQTILLPQIKMPDVLRPEKEFSVSVSEKSGRPMTYTLAIVDDGLLDLTNFNTPNPWNEFYAREALGIRTWDMYDDVVGAYSGTFGSLFSTGGDEMLKGNDAKANRFRPIVKYLGPFTLNKGQSNTHKIQLPMYVGSVRTMVVAGQRGAYGNAEKTTPVRSPLMLLSTLPRILSTGEEILLPVNVFAMEDGVKEVNVSIETSSNLQLVDGNKKMVTFTEVGDQMAYFKIKTGFTTGKEIIKIIATGKGHTASETIEIEVRNPNPAVTQHQSEVLEKEQKTELTYQLGSPSKENWVKLEVSRIPSVDISRRLDYLYSYYHSCTEQITSKALPLLFVSQFKETNVREQEAIKKNVQEAIKQLYTRQLSNGGFAYWSGNAYADEWVSSYVGLFLVMAQEKGYEVNANTLSKWKDYQRSAARNWTPVTNNLSWYMWQSDLQQAFRLYTLALAGSSELGAMNRLKEVKTLSMQAKWRLAAAYAINGKMDVANLLVFNMQTTIDAYSSDNYVYGSSGRDEAMILETLVLMDKQKEAFTQAQKISRNLSAENYFSTQSTAFSLMAMGRLAEKTSGSIDMEWMLNGVKQSDVKSAKAIYQAAIPTTPDKGMVFVKNNGTGSLYVDLISRTQLLNDTLPAIANNLRIEAHYKDMKGKPINVNTLKQGTDFVAVVKVSNISGTSDYKNIALTHMIPSGWEIYNERMFASQYPRAVESKMAGLITYQDIRDDRVLTYFDLKRGQSKVIEIRLQATYAGTFVLPAILCEPMYDVSAQARTKAGRVMVVN